MLRETSTLLARRYLGRASLDEFVDWAFFLLEEGYDTKQIRMLSSLGSAPTWADVTYHFGQILDELNWTVPSPPELLRVYAHNLAEGILEGTVQPVAGCRLIYGIYSALEYPVNMIPWLYLDDGLEQGTYQFLEGESLDKAIRQEARRFLETAQSG